MAAGSAKQARSTHHSPDPCPAARTQPTHCSITHCSCCAVIYYNKGFFKENWNDARGWEYWWAAAAVWASEACLPPSIVRALKLVCSADTQLGVQHAVPCRCCRADYNFLETAAHEFGHSILRASPPANPPSCVLTNSQCWSFTHKGTSTIWQVGAADDSFGLTASECMTEPVNEVHGCNSRPMQAGCVLYSLGLVGMTVPLSGLWDFSA